MRFRAEGSLQMKRKKKNRLSRREEVVTHASRPEGLANSLAFNTSGLGLGRGMLLQRSLQAALDNTTIKEAVKTFLRGRSQQRTETNSACLPAFNSYGATAATTSGKLSMQVNFSAAPRRFIGVSMNPSLKPRP